jgi:metal-responsive CopG/Arc/MetJ family transcriptional regulator
MSVNITLTLPEKILQKIDKDRGDVNRSRYVLRLLERAYQMRFKSDEIEKVDSVA